MNFLPVRQDGLPQYTTQEEYIHVISHLFGILLGLVVLIYSLINGTRYIHCFPVSYLVFP